MTLIPEVKLIEEVRLLLPLKWNEKLFKQRCEKWDQHIASYARIKCGENCVRDARIQFVKDHLDVLDRKFGVLLQFQALIATTGSIIFTGLYRTSQNIPAYSHSYKRLVGTMCGLWVIDAILCLSGMRRLFWGDMAHFEDDSPHKPTAEQVHVGALRTEVIKRTAKFRVAVSILVFMVALLPGLIYATVRKTLDLWPVEFLLGGVIVACLLIYGQHRERPFEPYSQIPPPEEAPHVNAKAA